MLWTLDPFHFWVFLCQCKMTLQDSRQLATKTNAICVARLQDIQMMQYTYYIYTSFHLGSLSLLRCSALRFNIADEVSHHPTIRDSLGEEFTTIIPSPSADSLVCCQKDDPRKSRAECTRRHTKQCEKMYQTKYICVSLFIFLKNNIKGLFFFDQKLL